MIFIPPKDSEHCIINFFDTKTGENLGQVEDIKEVNMTSGCQIDYARDKHGNMPDAYDIQFIKFVQARKHKKRRINKKWLKRYGYKQITVESKGWKMKTDTNGNVEFIK